MPLNFLVSSKPQVLPGRSGNKATAASAQWNGPRASWSLNTIVNLWFWCHSHHHPIHQVSTGSGWLVGWVFPAFLSQDKPKGLNHSTIHPCPSPGTTKLFFSHRLVYLTFARRASFSRSFSYKTSGRDEPRVLPDTLKLLYPIIMWLMDQKHSGDLAALPRGRKHRILEPGSIRAQKTYSAGEGETIVCSTVFPGTKLDSS